MHSEQFVQIPEMYNRRKLNALYREIPMQDAAFRMLRKYFNAAANLYGVIPVRKVYEIFQDQNPGKISRDQFLAFSEIARHECEDYYILGDDELYADGRVTSLMDRELIDVSLLDTDFGRYLQLKELQRGKGYYLPTKSEFLSYNDPFYCAPSNSVSLLKQYLHEDLHLPEDQSSEVYCELVYGARCLNSAPSNAINRLSEMGIEFESETDLKCFLSIYMQFHDRMRMQCNRGYTPAEMRSMASTDKLSPEFILSGGNLRKVLKEEGMAPDTLRREILRMNLPSEELRMQLLKELVDITSHMNPAKKQVKIGRNDLCPCGSGKKYKKCCGR